MINTSCAYTGILIPGSQTGSIEEKETQVENLARLFLSRGI